MWDKLYELRSNADRHTRMSTDLEGIQVIILAGGLATRLRPLSLSRPKALVPICNISVLSRMLTELDACGISEAIVTLPPMSAEITYRAFAAAPPNFHLHVKYPSDKFGGTVPAVRELLDTRNSSVLVIYGDSLLSVDFASLLQFHSQARDRGATVTILSHKPSDINLEEADGRTLYGVMAADQEGRVTRFVEKPRIEEVSPVSDVANAAVFICERKLFEDKRFLTARDFSYDIFEPAVNQRLLSIYSYDIGKGFRYDIGTLRRFYEVNIGILNGNIPAYIPGEQCQPKVWSAVRAFNGARLDGPVLLGAGVTIAGNVQIGPNAIIGDSCIIQQGTIVARSILMEGCKIEPNVVIDSCILDANCIVEQDQRLPAYSVVGAYSVLGNPRWRT